MKIFISVDMEGIAGIAHNSQEIEEKDAFRKSLHNQIQWIVEGIKKSTTNKIIKEIVIADSHGEGLNLSYCILSQLDDRISLISGSPRKQFMMSQLDETFDMVFLVGYHAGPGEEMANMEHCFYGKVVHRLWVNDKYMNEATVNSIFAKDMKVPVGLVIGDSGLYRQLIHKEMMPWVKFIVTKESLSRYAVKYKPQNTLRAETIETVINVLESNIKEIPLYEMKPPYNLKIEFHRTCMADVVEQIPNTIRENGDTISIICNDSKTLLCCISALTRLAATI